MKILILLFAFTGYAQCQGQFNFCMNMINIQGSNADKHCFESRDTCEREPEYLNERNDSELEYIRKQADIDSERRNGECV